MPLVNHFGQQQQQRVATTLQVVYSVRNSQRVDVTSWFALRILVPIDDLREREPVACGCLRFCRPRVPGAGASRRCFGDPSRRRGVTGGAAPCLPAKSSEPERQPARRHPSAERANEGKQRGPINRCFVPAAEDGGGARELNIYMETRVCGGHHLHPARRLWAGGGGSEMGACTHRQSFSPTLSFFPL